jgi:hypothetical protein
MLGVGADSEVDLSLDTIIPMMLLKLPELVQERSHITPTLFHKYT